MGDATPLQWLKHGLAAALHVWSTLLCLRIADPDPDPGPALAWGLVRGLLRGFLCPSFLSSQLSSVFLWLLSPCSGQPPLLFTPLLLRQCSVAPTFTCSLSCGIAQWPCIAPCGPLSEALCCNVLHSLRQPLHSQLCYAEARLQRASISRTLTASASLPESTSESPGLQCR